MTDFFFSRPDQNSILFLVPDGHERAPVELLARDGYDRLVAVVCDGIGRSVLETWCQHRGGQSNVGVVAVGETVRSTTTPDEQSPQPLVSVLSLDNLDDITDAVDDLMEPDVTSRTALYVRGIVDLLSKTSIGTVHAFLDRVVRLAGRTETTVIVAVPISAPDAVAAGFAPQFDTVLEVLSCDESTTVQPYTQFDCLSPSRTFDLLTPARRRVAIRILDEQDDPVGLDDLSSAIAAQPIDDPLVDDLERLRVTLYQTDIPTLVDAGIVDYDARRQQASLRPHAVQLWPLLDATARADGWWRWADVPV